MNEEMKVVREVNAQAEIFYTDAKRLGDHAAHALKAAHRSQMTGLENIAESALKTSDIFDYIKKQIARFSYWRQGFPESENPNEAFGESLIKYLEEDLAKRRDIVCSPKRLNIGNSTDAERQERRRIYLLLMRQFIRQMVVQYEYQVSIGMKKREW